MEPKISATGRRLFVRLDHVARLIVNANHAVIRAAEKLCMADCVSDSMPMYDVATRASCADPLQPLVGRPRATGARKPYSPGTAHRISVQGTALLSV